MDISDTLAPNSDQLDAVDLLGGPRTFTITKVDVREASEQPVTIHLAEFPRPWKPGKNMRRVLSGVWGGKSSVYRGRRIRLYCDTSVMYAGQAVGGIRIQAMSDIDGPKKVPIIPTRGKSALYTVKPLTTADIVADLRAEWKHADPERRKVIETEVAALSNKLPAASVPDTERASGDTGDDPAQQGTIPTGDDDA